jgi:hypothetical protein
VLQTIADSLNESSVSGAALRAVIKSAFEQVSAAVEFALPYVQAFFEGGILLALKLYNALYPVRQAIAKMFGGESKGGVESFQDTIINFADNVGKGFTVAALAIAWMIENAGALAKVVEQLILITPGIGTAFETARSAITLLTANLGAGNDKTVGSGKNVADGVAQGIRQGTPAVEAAMAAMAAKGTKAFDEKMGIKSPSKVMQLRGKFIDQGLSKGVNDNADEPAGAMAGAGNKITGAAPAGGGGSADGVTVSVVFQDGAIRLGGSSADSPELRSQLTELFADVLQQAALKRGA